MVCLRAFNTVNQRKPGASSLCLSVNALVYQLCCGGCGCCCDAQVAGLPTNLAFLQDLSAHPAFIDLDLDTGFIERHRATLLDRAPAPTDIAALAAALWAKLQVCLTRGWGCLHAIVLLGEQLKGGNVARGSAGSSTLGQATCVYAHTRA